MTMIWEVSFSERKRLLEGVLFDSVNVVAKSAAEAERKAHAYMRANGVTLKLVATRVVLQAAAP